MNTNNKTNIFDNEYDFFDDTEDFEISYSYSSNENYAVSGAAEEESTSSKAPDSSESKDSSKNYISPEDGYYIMLNHCGYIDLEYWESITGISKERLIEEYGGKLMWLDPEAYKLSGDVTKGWLTKEQYIKGNVIKKYKEAVKLNRKTGLFDDNVEVLRSNLPEDVPVEDIHVNLGSTWVPVDIIIDFVAELLEMRIPPKIEYDPYLGKWSVQQFSEPNLVKDKFTYGTSRMSAIQIIKAILNARPVKVYDQVPRHDREGTKNVLNETQTLAAQEKERAIVDAWQDYIRGNDHVEEILHEAYMSAYGYTVTKYDGSFLSLPDLNPEITLHKHQKDAIAHTILSHNVLLAHNVGSGKTYEYVCGVHELIRMKLGKKAMIVVPNTTLEAVVTAYRELYPKDSIFVVYPKDFTPAKREKALSEMKSNKYSVIIMAYGSFDMITMSKQYAFNKKENEIRECNCQIKNAKSATMRRRYEATLKKLKKSIEKYKDEFKDKETACFDSLNVDVLVVDESHNYKNISLEQCRENIVGLHGKGSKKAENMLEKVEYVQKKGGRIIFATGTPLTNSLADLYVFQRYLQPEELKMCNIFHFNDWINTFCQQEHSFEVDVDSTNFRFTTRFSKFHNLPELMSIFSDVCNFYQSGSGELGLPEFNGYTDVVVKKSEAQSEYTKEIVDRTEAVRKYKVSRHEDNLLKITVDGRKCALDIRLVSPDVITYTEENKVLICAKNMAKLYHENPVACQIAFSDISTPKEGFNVYDELKRVLIENGVLPWDIKYIHDATTETKRAKLEADFNAGKVRILIGSTQKLGTGSNVQEKLLAVHHLDVPWRPADMVQREGRIIRQGNTYEEVFIYRYVTEASFDSYSWQLLENKQKFIAQFLSGNLSVVHRNEEDCADTVLSYAEIKALAIGNPLIKERVEVSNQLEHARINQRQERKVLKSLHKLSQELPRKVNERKRLIKCASLDREIYVGTKTSMTIRERTMFGEELLYALAGNVMKEQERIFDEYQGFDVILPKYMKPEKPYVILAREKSGRYNVKMDGTTPLGCSKRLDYALDHLGDTLQEHKDKYKELINQQKEVRSQLDMGNPYDDVVKELYNKLAEIDRKLKEGKVA